MKKSGRATIAWGRPGDLPFGDSADLAKATEYFDAIFATCSGWAANGPPDKTCATR